MNDQLARTLFMDYLYEEISAEDKQRLEDYLEKNPNLQKELDQLQQTRNLLQQMPIEEPAQKLLVVEPRKRSFGQWWAEAKNLLPQTMWGKTGFALAAGFALLMMIGSVAKVEIASTDAGYTFSLGQSPVAEKGLSAEQTEALIDQIRQENAAMLQQYANALNEQNQQQLLQVIKYVEQQRINDLQLIDQNLDRFQQANNYRWLQANEFLGEVLQNVHVQTNSNDNE